MMPNITQDRVTALISHIVPLLLLPFLCSCDEIAKLLNPDDPNVSAVYLHTDGVMTDVKENQIIKVMHEGEELFEMQYTSDLHLSIITDDSDTYNPPQLMTVGRFRNLEDVLLPINFYWSNSVQVIAQNGVIAKVQRKGDAEPLYLRMFIPVADPNKGDITIQCGIIEIDEKKFGPIEEVKIGKGETFIVRDERNNLFNLNNDYPNLKISSIYSGQKEPPMLTFCGIYNSITEISTPIGKWEEKVKIELNGGYYSQVKKIATGNTDVRLFVKAIDSNESVTLLYQIK